MTVHADVGASDAVKKAIPALAVLAGGIGDPAVRHRGTIGGSIANSDPAADYPGGVVGLGASIVTDRRTIAGDDFFLGLFETALEPDELITSVRFPIPDQAHYIKFKHTASGYAVVGGHGFEDRQQGSGRRHRRGTLRVPRQRFREGAGSGFFLPPLSPTLPWTPAV